MPIAVLHEDRHLLFVAKPARMMTVPAPGGAARGKGAPLTERLESEGRAVLPVHRLDYETSGVVMLAKDEETRHDLVERFRRHEVEKTYLALVQGWPHPAEGAIDRPIRDLGASARIDDGGRPARTRYRTMRRVGPCALLKLHPETGRHNQIRLHLAWLGHPIVGERKFAIGRLAVARHRRVLLHASALGLSPAHLDHRLVIKAPLPDDFERALERVAALGTAAPRTQPLRRRGRQR